ncbi:MAG: VanZ family protein [Turicibacter sp.]|nr:VanZ family protein [Turicibacter sp.]
MLFFLGSLLGGGVILGYFVMYKKVFKGKKRLAKRSIAIGALLCIYVVIVLGATLSRGAYYLGGIRFRPFQSYLEAWNSGSIGEWRNIILNICMFVPIGLLLPLLGKLFEKSWVTYTLGFLFSLLIESVQFIFHRGIAEVDDLINNTVGCMIGYGFILLWLEAMRRVSGGGKEKRLAIKVKTAQLPLMITLCTFSVIFKMYDQQEFGNLSISPTFKINMSNVEWKTNILLSDNKSQAEVYHATLGTLDEAKEIANQWFSYSGTVIDESQTNIYDETVIYYSEDSDHTIWIDFLGLTIDYNTWKDSNLQSGYRLEEVAEILGSYGVHLPEDVTFVDEGQGAYRLEAFLTPVEDYYLDGSIYCELTVDGKLKSMRNEMIRYDTYKVVDILSEVEAFERLKSGYVNECYLGFLNLSEPIEIQKVSLQYQLDTKGYYQPVYCFEVLNGAESSQILIPAIL